MYKAHWQLWNIFNALCCNEQLNVFSFYLLYVFVYPQLIFTAKDM